MAILKGAAAAVYYREPMLRTMGDIDLIVPQSMFDSAQSLMERSGFKRETEKPDTRHIAYQKDGITFELHHHFSHEGIDVERYVIQPFCWLYQIIRYIRRGIGTGRSSAQLAEDYNRSQARYDLLTRLGIE